MVLQGIFGCMYNFINNLAHVLCRLEIMFITLNGKSDVLQSLQG